MEGVEERANATDAGGATVAVRHFRPGSPSCMREERQAFLPVGLLLLYSNIGLPQQERKREALARLLPCLFLGLFFLLPLAFHFAPLILPLALLACSFCSLSLSLSPRFTLRPRLSLERGVKRVRMQQVSSSSLHLFMLTLLGTPPLAKLLALLPCKLGFTFPLYLLLVPPIRLSWLPTDSASDMKTKKKRATIFLCAWVFTRSNGQRAPS